MRAAGLTEVQLARLVCPIGVPGLDSKDPAVIAASTAAQLLIVGEKLASQEDEAPRARLLNGSPASMR
jgi:xanthine/CO dehydrogenase XdhC/CoxF family maturation factor